VRQVGQASQLANAKATEEAEEALRAVTEDFVSGAGVLHACGALLSSG
jgi:hypothetical protein